MDLITPILLMGTLRLRKVSKLLVHGRTGICAFDHHASQHQGGKSSPRATGCQQFLHAVLLIPGPGLPSDAIEKGRNFKIVTEVQQDGQNFTWSQHYPGGHSMTNKFTIGKECDMETMGGKKFKVREPLAALPSFPKPLANFLVSNLFPGAPPQTEARFSSLASSLKRLSYSAS